VAIEVKRGLDTVAGKNTRVERGPDRKKTQIERMVESAKNDGLKPIIVIAHLSHTQDWARSLLRDLFSIIKSDHGVVPEVILAVSGKAIAV
jgi:hypothetical protein